MASALVFLTDKPLPAKGIQTKFDATFINSKKKDFKLLQSGDAPVIQGDIIVEVSKKDDINWKPFLNTLGSKWKTQIVPLIAKDSDHKDTVKQIEGYPIHPIAFNGVDALGDWYLDYVSGLLKVRLK